MKQHLKRISAPASWNIARKAETYIMRPHPGGQSLAFTLPLSTVLRSTGIARTLKDVKYLLTQGQVQVCGRVRKDPKFPVGFLDTVSLPADKQYLRLTLNRKGSLTPIIIPANEAALKIAVVRNIRSNKDGFVYTLSDGRVISLAKKDAPTQSGMLITLPEQHVEKSIPLSAGVRVFLVAGKHKGTLGDVKDIQGKTLTIHTQEKTFTAPMHAAFVVGKEKPLITLTQI